MRAVWRLIWLSLARFTPIAFHRWRCLILRCFGAEIAKGCYVYPSTHIWAPWKLKMRRGSCLAAGVDCYNVGIVEIGEGATVSQRSYLCSASHDFDAKDFPLIVGAIKIEAGAWVAAEAFIGPGVTIGKRAVVLARSVVVRDVEAEHVTGGNPAKTIRRRRSNRIVEKESQ